MNTLKRIRVWQLLLVMASVIAAAGCATHYREGQPAYGSSYYDDPYDYYYYPDSRVYFNISSGYYYYPDRDRWYRVRELPPRYHLDNRGRVPLRIATDKPYSMQHDHQKKFRPNSQFKFEPKRDQDERRENERRHEKHRSRHDDRNQ